MEQGICHFNMHCVNQGILSVIATFKLHVRHTQKVQMDWQLPRQRFKDPDFLHFMVLASSKDWESFMEKPCL